MAKDPDPPRRTQVAIVKWYLWWGRLVLCLVTLGITIFAIVHGTTSPAATMAIGLVVGLAFGNLIHERWGNRRGRR